MLDTLKTLILDSQEARLDTGVPRRLHVQTVPGKATVCIGVRRSGKSTYMLQIIERLLSSGVPRENIVHLNLFDDRLHSLRADNLGLITEAYYSLYPNKKNAETVHFFFDEVQAVPGWEPFVDRLMRTEQCEVYLTGSSARMLSREIATQMRGRSLSWEVFPFSFKEFLDARSVAVDRAMSTKQELMVRQAFEAYWECGGFPEVLNVDRAVRIKTHQEYLNAIMFRDLVERHDPSHPKALSDLSHWLLENSASLYSINALTGYLKSLGHKVPKTTVSQYVDWFEDAYFLFTVRLFDASVSRSNANPKKVYCIDHSMVTSVSSGLLVNSGHLLENIVFVALRRLYPSVYYYRTRSGREVDFAVPGRTRTPMLYQVCESMVEPQTKKREVTALTEAMQELGVEDGTIITRSESGEIPLVRGTVRVVPAWRFLLEQPDFVP